MLSYSAKGKSDSRMCLNIGAGRQRECTSGRKREKLFPLSIWIEECVVSFWKYTTKSRILRNSHKSLNNLADTNSVTPMWVPWHSCVEGNIKADNLAKLGAKMAPIMEIFESFIKRKLRYWTAESHSGEWDRAEGYRESKTPHHYACTKNYEEAISGLARKRAKILVFFCWKIICVERPTVGNGSLINFTKSMERISITFSTMSGCVSLEVRSMRIVVDVWKLL